jgi:RNA polymerase sigma-70 factor, ECF subfamily
MALSPTGRGLAAPPSDPTPACVSAARVEAFVSLIAHHQRHLRLFVLSLVPNPADADDVLQETHLVLWREFHRYEPGTNFAAWACAVAGNQVLAWRKKRQRDRLVFSDEFLAAVSGELVAAADRLEERAEALTRCVERVPPHHRELIRLRYAEGCPIAAIAGRLGRTSEAVYRMLSRVRQALYDCVTGSLAGGGGP